MFKTLIDRQDHQLAGAAEFAFHQDPGEVGFGAGVVALIMRQDSFNSLVNPHFHLQIVPRSI
jgi:hypothetical protein